MFYVSLLNNGRWNHEGSQTAGHLWLWSLSLISYTHVLGRGKKLSLFQPSQFLSNYSIKKEHRNKHFRVCSAAKIDWEMLKNFNKFNKNTNDVSNIYFNFENYTSKIDLFEPSSKCFGWNKKCMMVSEKQAQYTRKCEGCFTHSHGNV